MRAIIREVVPVEVGTIWFVFGDERYDPTTDHPLENGFLTWRRCGQLPPSGARYFAGVSLVGDVREIHYETPEYHECVRDYVSQAAERLLMGEQYAHSQFRKLTCPPHSMRELPDRLRLLDAFEEEVLRGDEDDNPDTIEDTILVHFGPVQPAA